MRELEAWMREMRRHLHNAGDAADAGSRHSAIELSEADEKRIARRPPGAAGLAAASRRRTCARCELM